MTGVLLSSITIAFIAAFSPARFISGDTPAVPIDTVAWDQANVEVTVAVDGSVRRVDPLGPSTPSLELLIEAVRGWQFTPARAGEVTTETQVLVAGIYRPPVLMAAAPPEGFAAPPTSPSVPQPVRLMPPFYPPTALFGGAVVVEVRVDEAGDVDEIQVVGSGGAFTGAALDAAREWRFSPATRAGTRVPAYVYLVFGFRAPIVEIE
jgi:TonB family protein